MSNFKQSALGTISSAFRFLKSDRLYQHLSIIVLAAIIICFNLIYKNHSLAMNNNDFGYCVLDATIANEVIKDAAQYTKFDEDLKQVQMSFAISENDEYLTKDKSVDTEKSKLEREYLVQKGDTITTIASKFGLHVATILDRNGISVNSIESIAPGQTIIIPPKDTSDSKKWLADLNFQKEQERQRQLELERKRKAEQDKKRRLASKKRSVYTRDRSTSSKSSTGYSGSFKGGFVTPISHNGISRGLSRYHAGIDYRASVGTPVRAAAAGKVVGSSNGWGSGYGKSVVIDHGGGRTTRYAHLNGFTCSVGQSVGQGQVIGYSGNTGWSTGPHLHFETRVGGTPINPF